jgi:hypothetical protein
MNLTEAERRKQFLDGDWKSLENAKPVDMGLKIWHDVNFNDDPHKLAHALKWLALCNLKLQETANQLWWFALFATVFALVGAAASVVQAIVAVMPKTP